MKPVTSHVRSLMAYLMAWMLAGVLMAMFLVSTHHAYWLAALAFALPVCMAYGFIAASAYYVCRSLPVQHRRSAQTVVVFGSASLLSGGLWTLLCQAWNKLGDSLTVAFGFDPNVGGELITISQEMTIVLLLLASALYVISLLMHDVLMVADKLRLAQTHEAESRVLARDAELQVLRTQINPHFLFNSLNSISALTTIDASAARHMTLELAAFFRQTLVLSEREKIPLTDEIALCGHFLAVEKVRFGTKLWTDVQVSDAAQTVLIPPMLLQPCVENAVKHGIRNLAAGGCVTLRAWVREDWLYVVIENPVAPDLSSSESTGTGLGNIKRRLLTLYGDRARAQWTCDTEKFTVEIVIPLGEEG
jgi:hypothetical protein